MDNKQTVQGFTLLMGRYTIIYIDTEGSSEIFKEILVHEFSHVIDYSISKSLLNGWIELLPQNIAEKAYLNSYQADYSLDYTPYGKGSLDVWFYDGYSRTFPTEDRAVIFQKMYYSHTEGKMTDEFKNHENLRKKARYYCVMLRRTFESCKNAETLPWEELFGKIDITEFD